MITMGMDIGSTTSKCVILRDGVDILGHALMKAGIGTQGAQQVYAKALDEAGLTPEEADFTTATGYGRSLFQAADSQVSELTCHALGARRLIPGVRTIIDIGGQDAKVISLSEQGQMQNFLMNDKCAAGTGRFLDVMANILQMQVGDLETAAAQATRPAVISNTCTVFAESEVISQLAQGVPVPDVVAGICDSVAGRVASLAKRVGVREIVCMSGGVAVNGGVRKAMERILGVEVVYSPMAQLAGALGAAISAYQKGNH